MAQVIHWVPMKAGAAVGGRKIVHLTGNNQVAQAVAATQDQIGISGRESVAKDGTVEVAISGIAEVILGGTVAAGNYVAADANGDAVAASTAKDEVVGFCVVGGADGDIGEVLIAPHTI